MIHHFRKSALLSIGLIAILATGASASAAGPAIFNVMDFGATGKKSDDARAAIQKAIEACAQAGGGMVYLPPGEYTSGTLYLRSHVRFHLEAGATLFGSTEEKDFDKKLPNHSALLYLESIENVTIEGRGTLDGQASYDWLDDKEPGSYANKRLMMDKGLPIRRTVPHGYPARQLYPFLIWINKSTDVQITGISLLRSPSWSICAYGSQRLVFDRLYIYTSLQEAVWADGIDLDGCRDVHISNCNIETGDDCIIFISSPVWGPALPCENITVTNCRLSTASAAVKFSEGNWVGVRRVTISNTVIVNANRAFVFSVTQGGSITDVVLNNLTIDTSRFDWFWAGNGQPFHFRITRASEWNRREPDPNEPPPGRISNVKISNVVARGKGTSLIAGHKESWLDGITFDNVKLILTTDPQAAYDTATHALKFQWAKNLVIRGLEVEWAKPSLDKWESALTFEDVSGLTLDGFTGRQAWPEKDAPAVVFSNVSDAVVRNARAVEGTNTFLKVSGKGSNGIILTGNDLRQSKIAVLVDKDAPKDAVKEIDTLK
jgi:hypothetical protein